MGSLELQLVIPTQRSTMKFLFALSAPANVYSPYLLQDLAYNSVDANMDGQPDRAIAITHPVAYRTVAAPAPINLAAPAAITYPARAAFAYSMPVQTAVHYKSTPVVVGHSTQILKPSLAAPVAPAFVSVKAVAEEKAEEAETIAVAAPAYYAGAHFGLNLAAAVPAGDAPHFDELFTQEKVLAPVRTSSQITQQVTVRHPTKVNVEKVAVDVAVPTPYAHPVPVAVPGPHYAYSAPHFVHP